MSTTTIATYDVVVVGAGNAALCAALAARERGASVVVLEKASPSSQGGNCPYTGGGFRFVHNGVDDLRSLLPGLADAEIRRVRMDPYTPDDYRAHFLTVTRGEVRRDLLDLIVGESRSTVEWMRAGGVDWELPGSGRSPDQRVPSTIPSSVGLTAFRSGPGLIQMLTVSARRAGVTVLYETAMRRLLQERSGGVSGVEVEDADGVHEVRSDGVVLACGGFEASAEMRARYLGPGWAGAKVRGSPHNTGDGHRAAMEVGARVTGQWDGCHCTPIDVNAPATGNLALTDSMPRRSYPLGITVNAAGRRFTDEGAGFAEQTFVEMGKAILAQDGAVAYQVFDARAVPHLELRYGSATPVRAESIEALAERLGLDASALGATVAAYNAAAHDGEYEPRRLDGRRAGSLAPPKSNWAIRLDAPPFVAYGVTGGITYTYGGLAIDGDARVLGGGDRPIPGLFAAGEIVGGIFYHNSLRAAGLMHGSVFGRRAGANAAGRACAGHLS